MEPFRDIFMKVVVQNTCTFFYLQLKAIDRETLVI